MTQIRTYSVLIQMHVGDTETKESTTIDMVHHLGMKYDDVQEVEDYIQLLKEASECQRHQN